MNIILKHRQLTRKSVVTIISLLLSTEIVVAFNEISTIKAIYNFYEWAGKTKEQYSGVVTNLTVNFGERYEILNKNGKDDFNSGDKFYVLCETNNPKTEISVRTYECDSVLSAHKRLMEIFSSSSAVHPFPLGKTKNINIGDRCYIGYGYGVCLGIEFVRNNILVNCTSVSVPVLDLAKEIDAQILEASGITTNINKSAETQTDKKSKTDKTK